MKKLIRKISLLISVLILCHSALPLFIYASDASPVIIEAEGFEVGNTHNFKLTEDSSASEGYSLKTYVNNTAKTPSYNDAGYIEYSFNVSQIMKFSNLYFRFRFDADCIYERFSIACSFITAAATLR